MIELKYPFILASGSPRRKEILETMRIPFVVDVSEVDESFSGSHQEAVVALSERKAKRLRSDTLTLTYWLQIRWFMRIV